MLGLEAGVTTPSLWNSASVTETAGAVGKVSLAECSCVAFWHRITAVSHTPFLFLSGSPPKAGSELSTNKHTESLSLKENPLFCLV